MKILALETTEMVGRVAAMDDGRLLGEHRLDADMRSARSLAPGIKQLWRQVGWNASDVDLIAVTIGPGSFTGIRIGVATAKTLAYAIGVEVLGVNTLDLIAVGSPDDVTTVSVAVDAQRGDVVAATFQRGPDGQFSRTTEDTLIASEAWLDNLPDGAVLSGPVLGKLADRVPSRLTMVPPENRVPTAAVLARLAQDRYGAGHRDDLWELAPRYSRRSAAEEKWEERNK